uniref:Msx2-interacting protein n=1 Tax=Sinocyclocheilus rhinocerous TaxID=307959 RepID=A0A673GJZ0_9TELE
MVRETRHLWVGNLPEHVREEKIVEHFKRYGRVESVKVLRKRGSEGGVAAFVDFVDIKSAQKAHNAVNKMGDRDLRTDYNEPGSVPSAVRGLEDPTPSSSHGREVAGFSRSAVGPVYGPPVSLHTREGRYERRLDGSGSDSRERAYDHSPYGHHERSGSFDRPRHYNTEYYRDRAMFTSGVSSSPAASAISGGFDAPESHFESRIRDPFTISSSARRDPYRDDRGRRTDRTYHHRRSRSSHSSQSRQPSPQRSAGQTPKAAHSPKRAPVSPGRGPRSCSRSPSSSSDSVSSTSSTGSGSSDSNSSSSEGSRARSVQSTATHAPPAPPVLALDSDEPRRSFGIRVQNLPTRSTDTSLKDGLFHEFKKYGKVTSVQIHGASEERYGLVFFRQQEDQEKALGVSKGKLFFGMLIEVTVWNGPETESENEFRPLDGRIDEFHPKATRTLFIGNLEKTTNYQQLLDVFQRFGEIVDIDIKRVNGVPQYAFVQYSDIASVCKAIKKMDGEYLGANRLKLGFGKSMPTACVWLDGLTSNITEQYLTRHFCRYGPVVKVVFDRLKGMGLILYNNTDFAQAAVRETKGWKIGGNKIKVDFASQESQMAFYRSMQASGQDIRDFYDIPSDRRDERRTPYDFSTERAYYENVRTPAIYSEDPRREYPGRSRDRYAELDYQGEHYDPRYHEDPREYRDYRDPFEDIRKYSYIQRERERERERFEAERGRWSPSHQRRPPTPSASPSPSDRVSRDAERRVFRHSSERSGSCSSLSPPPAQFEKSEKSPVDYKSEGLEREMEQAEAERVSGAENKKRGRRREKADREKGEKAKQRRGKVQSPSVPHSEADREASLDLGSGKVKVSDVESQERQKHKGDKEPSPTDQVTRLESQKGERLDQCKSESLDRDGKGKAKKHLKSDSGSDGKDSLVDSVKLEARKRRFGDPGGKAIRQKRGRLEEDPGSGISLPADFATSAGFAKETDIDVKAEKEAQKREHSKSRIGSHYSQREELDGAMRGTSQGPMVRSGELPEVDVLDSKSHPGPSISRRFSTDGTSDKDNKVRDEYLENIDLSQSYRKQMEQNRRLRQQLQPLDKPGKPETPLGVDAEDLEHRSLVHEVGKPPQDVTDNSPPSKIKKQESFEMDMNAKRERIYRTVRQKSEDLEWNNTNSPRFQHAPQQREEEYADPHAQMTVREVKEALKPEDNAPSDQELGGKRMHASQMSKMSTSLQDEQQRRWESRLKQDLLPDFTRSAEKRRLNQKYLDYGLWPDLEPGEVRSDSEEDRENKPNSPAPSTSVSFSERHRPDRSSESKLTNETPTNNAQPEAEPPVKFPESPSPLSHIPAEQHEKEPEPPAAPESESNNADDQKCADNYPVEEAVSPPPKSRNKRAKTSPTTPVTTPDKQSTRKSERIDKEKLKRSSSPRGEAFKTTPDSKSLSKSPVHSIETEQCTEQNSQSGRARRRNVRSIYATPIEDETALQPGKDAESPRGARKRVDRDVGSDVEAVAAPSTSKRGRPPKNRRQAEDVQAGKVERSKSTESKELDGSETSSEGLPKVGKGKFSPPTQKGVSPGNASASGIGKKGDKMEKISESPKLITEENPPILKNLRIRLDVTEVKAMLQTSEEEPGTDESPKNSSPGVSSKDEVLEAQFENDAMDDANSESETLPAAAKANEPHVASLARELELEQAVENIAKLTEDATSLPFKSNLTKAQRLAAEVPERESEEEKPANPSSETELAAAIDSITSENTEQITNSVVETDPDVQTLRPGSKVSETCVSTAVVQEETVTTPRKGCKGRAKTSKKGKGQKGAGSKKEPIKDVVLEAENIPVKSLESVPAELPAATERSPASTAVVITSSSKQGGSLPAPNTDIPNEPESPLKTEMDIPKSSPAISRSPTSSKYQPYSYKNTSPSLSPTRTCLKNVSSYPSRLSVSPTERCNQPKEAGVLSPPLTSVAPMESPTLPSDTPAHDANSGDLRKILTKPRTVPVLEISATSGNMHSHPLKESVATPDVVTSKSAPQDKRQPPISAQPVVRQPASIPSPETKHIFSEKSVISVIASTPTSVISRVCNPPDSEEKPNAQIGNPFLDKQPPKQIYQPSLEESSTYHGPAVGEEGGNAGRYIVESTSLSTGSSTGLRVQTSEGVVVLSHSGQKIEGPLRISAKISQIPPASAVDIESQQLVSMPQIKQELYSASHPPSSKCPLPSDHGHSIKPHPNVSTIKQESALDKLESAYAPVQSGVVKILQQTPGPSQAMSYHPTEYPMVMKHPKKGDGPESLNVEKPAWVPTISPAISPHLPSAAGNHVGFITGTATERTPSLIQPKQEPRSPRKSGHPHSPFAKVSSPIGSSSPKGVSMVLPPGLNPLSQYVSTVHHSEQSVIMPPHNTHGSIGRMSPHRVSALGHLTQGEVRVNTPPLSMMNYGIHSESLASSWAPGQQRPTSPQAVGNREMVLKVNPANARPPAAQLKPDSIPAEYRGALHSGLPLDRFNRDMRVLMHHQQSDRPAVELHQGHVPENITPSSTPTRMAASLSPRPHLLVKGVSEKDSSKASELNRAQSPSSKEGMMAIRSAMPPMASPQRVQLIPAGTAASFTEYSTMYTNLRPAHAQFAENSPMGINQSTHSIPPSQGVQEPESSQAQAESEVELAGHQPVNMVQLLTKYPIVWQGLLALKNDTAAVQLHFLCGNKALGLRSLPLPESGGILRIVQRMRLEAQQLEGVARRMTGESDFCLLLAMPCGLDQEDVLNQTQALKSAFINYLQAKLAAGIINVPNPGSNQPAYVLQIFPPCEFSESHLSRLAPDLLSQISSISPHLMIVITSV